MTEAPTILVIDDDADIREAVRECLTMEGYQVMLSAHGKEALEMLDRGIVPSLILLDRTMPEMDAEEFLRHKNHRQVAMSAPVLLFTAGLCEALPGVQGVIAKPIDLDVLLETVKRLCRKS